MKSYESLKNYKEFKEVFDNSKSFANKYYLKKHISSKHADVIEADTSDNNSDNSEAHGEEEL